MTPTTDPVDSRVNGADDSPAAMFERTLAYEWRAHRTFWIALGLGGLAVALGHALVAVILSDTDSADRFVRFGFLAARNAGTVLLLGTLLRGAAAGVAARAVAARYRAFELSSEKRCREDRRLRAALRGRLLGLLPSLGLGALGLLAEPSASLFAGF